MDVAGKHRRHLPALHLGDAAARVKHEDVDMRAIGDRRDRRRPGVARGRANDGEMLVALGKEPLEQEPQHLQRDVLERQRRAVEQFEEPMLLVELDQWGHRVVAEAAIGRLAQ